VLKAGDTVCGSHGKVEEEERVLKVGVIGLIQRCYNNTHWVRVAVSLHAGKFGGGGIKEV
jgi:hypothetical protein